MQYMVYKVKAHTKSVYDKQQYLNTIAKYFILM